MEDIAHNVGVSVTSLYNWKSEHVEFLEALKKGKEVADYIVENALFKRACGFEYEETITEIYGEGDNARKHVKRVKKYMPPDTGAAAFWLKNRRPDKWRDRPVSDLPEDDALRQYLLQAERELNV